MNRKLILFFILILTITVFSAGNTAVSAAPLSQTESETAELPAETTEDEDIELINKEIAQTDDAAQTTEEPATEEDANSEPAEEIVPDPPEAPVPEAPKGITPSKEVGFYWAPSANADHYEIHWQNDRGYEVVIPELPADDWTCRSGRCILYEELPSDGNYTWTVTAINKGVNAVSEEISFSVKASIPSADPYLPGAILSNQRALSFQWSDVGYNVSAYHIQVLDRDSGQICMDKWYDAGQFSTINGVCLLDSREFLSSGSYAWRVQGRNDSSVSDWSGWKDFGINCPECDLGTYLNTETTIIAPNGTITDPDMPFTWKTVTGALNYQLEIKHSDGTELLLADVSSEACDMEICTYKPDLALKAGEGYEWNLLTYGWNNIFWGSDNKTFAVASLPETAAAEIEFIGTEDIVTLDPDNQQIIWTDPGSQTAAFRIGVSNADGEWLLVSDLTRKDAWCDGITCSVQFFSIPEGEGYQFTLVPYDEYNVPGEPVTLTFNNAG